MRETRLSTEETCVFCHFHGKKKTAFPSAHFPPQTARRRERLCRFLSRCPAPLRPPLRRSSWPPVFTGGVRPQCSGGFPQMAERPAPQPFRTAGRRSFTGIIQPPTTPSSGGAAHRARPRCSRKSPAPAPARNTHRGYRRSASPVQSGSFPFHPAGRRARPWP